MKKKSPNGLELWNQKVIKRLYNETFLPFTRSLFVKNLTLEIKKLSAAGLTSEQIAEKIDLGSLDDVYWGKGLPDMVRDYQLKIYSGAPPKHPNSKPRGNLLLNIGA